MPQMNSFYTNMLGESDPRSGARSLWIARRPTDIREENDGVTLTVPFVPDSVDTDRQTLTFPIVLRAYGKNILRASVAFAGQIEPDEDNPMLEPTSDTVTNKLTVEKTDKAWIVRDSDGDIRVEVNMISPVMRPWGDLSPEPADADKLAGFDVTLYPDGETAVPFAAYDLFSRTYESVAIGFEKPSEGLVRSLFAFHADPNEKFAGTGERFLRMNLAGSTIELQNVDARGAHTSRAYKNVPFIVSSRPYGLCVLTSAHVRLSPAGVSTRAMQGAIEDSRLDLFIIGGGSVERVQYNYRRLTGFPRRVPVWSYGTWMSRMTYFSAEESEGVAKRMREGDFPLDVIHLDTGWFAKNWACEWKFNEERFPNPAAYMKRMRDMGVRISLWQLPAVAEGTELAEEAQQKGFLPAADNEAELRFSIAGCPYVAHIDFSNPSAVLWYQSLL
ncbi:MAG: alpha-xylosidase, partial [Chitinivibrionales bacterium]|nr:alpha-xylosidase [Chitinivibrionales bacterium]